MREKGGGRMGYTIFEKLGLEFKPVGIKFSMVRPTGLPRLNKKLAICEMLREAQTSGGFYAERDDHACGVGPHILGQVEEDPTMTGGMIGPKISVYEEPRANQRIYREMKTLPQGTGTYTWFDTLDHMTFEPDLIILLTRPEQAEIVLRAYGYRTGRAWMARGTSVAGCACLYTYPFLTGELNMMVTGLHHGMRARGTFPPGLLMLSIPYQVLPEMICSLKKMTWDLPQYHWGKKIHMEKMREIGRQIAKEVSG